jgi:hypothetical protein
MTITWKADTKNEGFVANNRQLQVWQENDVAHWAVDCPKTRMGHCASIKEAKRAAEAAWNEMWK